MSDLVLEVRDARNADLLHDKWISRMRQEKVADQHSEILKFCEDGKCALETKSNLMQVSACHWMLVVFVIKLVLPWTALA